MNMYNRIFAALFGVFMWLGLPSHTHANLLVNGSFETPVVTPGTFANFLTGSTAITGWTVFGPAVSVVSGTFISGALSFPAQDGVQWLDLTGPTSGPMEGVNQNVLTTPGQTYNLSFYVGNIVGGGFGSTSMVGSSSTVHKLRPQQIRIPALRSIGNYSRSHLPLRRRRPSSVSETLIQMRATALTTLVWTWHQRPPSPNPPRGCCSGLA